MSITISVSLQENLLSLLAFSSSSASLIRGSVDPNLFGVSTYRDLAARIYDYIDKYRKPPETHLPDLFSDAELEGEGDAQRERRALIEALYEQRQKVNEEYVLSQLDGFVRQQTLKSSIIEASEALQETSPNLSRAEAVISAGLKARLEAFTPGMGLRAGLARAFAGQVRIDVTPTGIKQLDAVDFGPAKGEFFLMIAPPKRGKTWWLVHMTKQGLIHKRKVLYITLELSEAQINQRVLQALFSITRRKGKALVTRFKTNELGRLLEWKTESLGGRISFDDPSAQKEVEKKLGRLHVAENLIVKQFPAGRLTVDGLEAYLDMLERSEKFVPDMLLIDYPDYMALDPRNFRIDSMVLFNRLRGLGVERNVALLAASKSNRQGTDAKLVTETHTGEDYSRIYTADSVMTYSQTPAEKQLGLARLFANNTRVAERDRFVVLISQSYQIGQFCMDSVSMDADYWTRLEAQAPRGDAEEPEEAEE